MFHPIQARVSQLELGRTLPSLLDEACARFPNANALQHWRNGHWDPLSNFDFRALAAATARRLLGLGILPGDRVALLLHSDRNFALVDMACMMAGLVDVPIDESQTVENVITILRHSGAHVLVVSDQSGLDPLWPHLLDLPELKAVVLMEADWPNRLDPPNCPANLPLYRLDQLPQPLMPLPPVVATDLATIIYIPTALGQLQGVMLSQQNLSANAIASFSGIESLGYGDSETVLSFLPLTHVFARSLLYGHLLYGHRIYFSTPTRVLKHLKQVRPTILATVPVMLEKIYGKLVAQLGQPAPEAVRPNQFGATSGQVVGTSRALGQASSKPGPRRSPFLLHLVQPALQRALKLALDYRLGQPRSPLDQLQLYQHSLYPQLLNFFGGRLKILLCGGAALSPRVANFFAALGLPILHGYGLTQTSSVLCCNRNSTNRAGTVGLPIAGAELAIAHDGEVLVKGPFVMLGYWPGMADSPTDSRDAGQIIDEQGWFHTGDLGEFTDQGYLKIIGLKKPLFKLQTGKYVSALALEQRLTATPWVKQAVVVGAGQRFCAALIVPDEGRSPAPIAAEHAIAQFDAIVQSDAIAQSEATAQWNTCRQAFYQALIDQANCHLPHWSTIKQFRLVDAPVGLSREELLQHYTTLVEEIYGAELYETAAEPPLISALNCSLPALPSCPVEAQSMKISQR
jgi:long-chain acyl-CoA synthetase